MWVARKPENKCVYCGLPVRVHFAWCHESGIRADIPPEALTARAIQSDPREIRWLNPVPPHKRIETR